MDGRRIAWCKLLLAAVACIALPGSGQAQTRANAASPDVRQAQPAGPSAPETSRDKPTQAVQFLQSQPVPDEPVAVQPGQAVGELVAPPPEKPLELVQFNDVSMGEAARLFSDQTGMKIVVSTEASKVPVSLYLRDVQPVVALAALTAANGLFYREDQATGIIRIYTTKEYEADLGSFREEETEVFTLLYPNPVDVAIAIRDVFGADRVRMSLGMSEILIYQDLIQRFIRYNLVNSQNQQGSISAGGGGGGFASGGGMAGFGGGLGGGMGGMGMGGMGMGGMGMGMGGMGMGGMGMGGIGGFGTQAAAGQQATAEEVTPLPALEDLTPEQIQALEKTRSETDEEGKETIDELIRRHRARIYITAVRRNNQLVVRTSDQQTMQRIRELIQRLDVPTPLVLLEVKVLQLELGDNFTSAFDYQFASNAGDVAGSFTSGDVLAPPTPLAPNLGLGLNAAAGVIAPSVAGASVTNGGGVLSQAAPSNGPLIFQYVSDNFRMRIQLLENDNRVTELATPLLLTANNEVSHIFIGQYVPIVIGFTQSGAVSGGNTTTAIQPTPQTSYTSVGQGLLITPNINADRSVTLRVSQQSSSVVKGGASIPVSTSQTITNITGSTTTTSSLASTSVDTVQTQVVTGTVVAKDGLTVALGGLITEGVADSRAEVPVIGKLPVIGFFFRREVSIRSRNELVVLIRPYVFNTPSESALLSADLVPDNSLHPKAVNPVGSLNSFGSQEVLRPNPPQNPLQTIFRSHSVDPLIF